tara:strand:+ start:492 stop:713 length:222 start_codon:yes stop_codon:yes gene_type:complete
MAKRKVQAKKVEEIEVVEAIEVIVEETIVEPTIEDYKSDLRQVQDLLNSKPSQNFRRQLLRTQTELQDKIKSL